MAGLADIFGLGGGGMFGGDAASMYGDLLTPEMKQQMAFRGLMAAAGALGQAAMPSRMPVPIGAALGQAAGAMSDAQDKGLESALKALLTRGKLQELQSNLDYDKAALANMGQQPPMFAPGGAATGQGAALPAGALLGGAASSVGGSGGWGPLATPAVETLSGSGLSPAAVQGIMANGLGEGGFNDPWKKAGGGENSFGHWQFNQGGELPGYLAWAQGKGDPKDTKLQAQYVAQRMEELHPGFSQISDPKAATDLVALKFERYKGAAPGQRYGYLADVQRAMSGGTVEPRAPLPAAPGQMAEGDLPAVPDFAGAMAGNQGPSYAPAATVALPAPDTVVGGPPIAPPGGQIGAVGEGANARLVRMDTGGPVAAPATGGQAAAAPMTPEAQSAVAQMPAKLPASAPPPMAPYGGVNPAYIQWAQLQSQLLSHKGRTVPAYIAEAAALPLKYAEPGSNVGLQEQLAAAKARGDYAGPGANVELQGRLAAEKAWRTPTELQKSLVAAGINPASPQGRTIMLNAFPDTRPEAVRIAEAAGIPANSGVLAGAIPGNAPTSVQKEMPILLKGTDEEKRAYKDIKKFESPQTTINNVTDPIAAGVGKSFVDQREAALAAVNAIGAIHRAREQVDRGMISGPGTAPRVVMERVGELFGMPPDKSANTATFKSAIGEAVLSMVKGLGTGSGITNADRDFAERMAGGQEELGEKAIRQILDIREKAERAKIKAYSVQAGRLIEQVPESVKHIAPLLRVDEPPVYSRAPLPPGGAITTPYGTIQQVR